MASKKYKPYTVYLDPDIVETAKYKSEGNISKLIRSLLLDYASIDGSIEELERKKAEADRKITAEKIKKASYEKRIKELEAEKVRNANNLAIMDSCYKTIKRAVDKKGFITIQTLKGISKAKNIDISELNDLCLKHNFRIE